MHRTYSQKEKFYYHAAKRFMLDAKMLRCKAAIHVEDKDDIIFWSEIFGRYRPRDKFHFIAGSRNEKGRETKGVTQCLKYLSYLNSRFFICIDSDYRYLLKERKMNIRHHVFQTYTYSIENHHCFEEGLNDICRQVTGLPNRLFDFRRFLQDYSGIVYELFLWHLYFMVADSRHFPVSEFNEMAGMRWGRSHPDIRNNGKRELNHLANRVNAKLKYFRQEYPKADLEFLKEKYGEMGLTPKNTYLYIRGHNIYDMVYMLMKEVCKKTLRQAREEHQASPGRINLFGYRHSIDDKLKQHLIYDRYYAMRLIEEDINEFFGTPPLPSHSVLSPEEDYSSPSFI